MIRFFNGRVLTSAETVEEKELWTDGDKIAFVGMPTPQKLAEQTFEREIDLGGSLLMPSFKNAHTHSAMTFLRSYADDLPLREWLFDRVFPMEAKLDGEKIYWLTKLAILEYLTTGVTAVYDMYFEMDYYVKACVESGFRTVLCDAVSGNKKRIVELEEKYEKFNGCSPLVKYDLGFHAEYTAELGLLEEIAKLSERLGTRVSTHNSETEKEVRECIEKYGKTPTELFDSVGLLNHGGAFYHCVHLTDNDIEIIKNRGMWVVHCPASNLKLASGIAPIVKLADKGIGLALGTDGPASNNCLDMFREMFLMTGLQKIQLSDAAACPADLVLDAATRGGALAMYLPDCDSIAEGKQADLTVLDLHRPNMQPLNNIPKNIVYSGSKENVKLTMCAGKILYENGEFFINEDPELIYQKANDIISSMR